MSTLNQEAHYRRMTQDSIPHLITQLAIPTIISMLVTSIYNMADTLFLRSSSAIKEASWRVLAKIKHT